MQTPDNVLLARALRAGGNAPFRMGPFGLAAHADELEQRGVRDWYNDEFLPMYHAAPPEQRPELENMVQELMWSTPTEVTRNLERQRRR